MANSTARVAGRNPTHSAAPEASLLSAVLGSDCELIDPGLQARILEAIQATRDEAANSHSSTFLHALSGESVYRSSMGGTWENAPIAGGFLIRMASVDKALSGISGVADVLAARELAEDIGVGEPILSPNLADRLFNALQFMTHQARNDLELVRRHVTGDGQ